MQAEIVAIGDELTSGQRLDTNSQWLSQQLGQLGIPVVFHTTVADDLPSLVDAFRTATGRAAVVISSGGLGPTADDLTREALAVLVDRPLVENAAAREHIRSLFARRRRPMPERNIVQAMLPDGARLIPNPHGTAPGIDLDVTAADRQSRIFALPGVPAEMREMWTGTVQPALLGTAGRTAGIIVHHQIRCFGVGESDLEQMLPDLIRRGRQPSVGITVSQATITLRVTAMAADDRQARSLMAPTIATIHECLGPLVFGEGEDELWHVVTRQLSQVGKTLAVAEGCTGGLIAHWFQGLSEADHVFRGGWVMGTEYWSPDGDADGTQQQVSQLAEQCRQALGADLGLAVGPAPRHESAGTIPMALAGGPRSIRARIRFLGHPDILQARAGKQALDVLRRHLSH